MIEVRVDTSNSFDEVRKWWNSLSIDERTDYLKKNGWADISWGGYKFQKLHFGLQGWLFRKYEDGKKKI